MSSPGEEEKVNKKGRGKFSFTFNAEHSGFTQKKEPFHVEIKREPKKTPREYLQILKQLDMLLRRPGLSEARRNDYCKSQRYFMKLYLRLLEEQI